MPFKTVNGLSIHYQIHEPENPSGQEPIVLLSGMASDSASWQPVIQGLRHHHLLIIPDNRCTGQTTPNPVSCNRDALIGDALALLDSLGVERFHIVGHSMGGMLGWAIAAAAPHRVLHLVAAAALPSVIPARVALFRSLAALRTEQTEDEWFRLLYHFLFKPEFFNNEAAVSAAVAASQSYPYKQGLDAFTRQVAGLASFLEAPDTTAFTGKVTMITGSHDMLLTPDMMKQFASSQPEIELHVIDQAAHALHWEQPDAFVRCVTAALDQSARHRQQSAR